MSDTEPSSPDASSSGSWLIMFGVVISIVALVGTLITANEMFGQDDIFGDDLAEWAKWQPVLIGLSAIALGLIVTGVGMAVSRMDLRRA